MFMLYLDLKISKESIADVIFSLTYLLFWIFIIILSNFYFGGRITTRASGDLEIFANY